MANSIDLKPDARADDPAHQHAEFMRLCLDAAPAGIAMFDRDMRYLAVNHRFTQAYKLGESDILGKCHYDLFPDIPPRWRDIHRRCLSGATERCELEPFHRDDGTTIYVRWEIRPWFAADGTIGGILLFTEDRSAYIQADAERQQWADVFQNAAFAIAIGDPDTRTIRFANPAYAAMRQMTVAEVAGMKVRDAYPPEEWERLQFLLAEADKIGHVIFESLHLRKDGSTFPVLMNITSVRHIDGRRYRIASVTDITERKSIETELQLSEARYRKLLDSIHDGVFIAQGERFVFYNRRFAEMLGADGRFLVDPSFEAVLHPNQLELFRGRFRSRIAGQKPPAHYETALRHQITGKPVHVLLHASRTEHEGRPAVLGTVADISERRLVEDQLRQAMKMEAIGHLTGGIAHDFNNLLTVIIGNLDLAAADTAPGTQPLVQNALKGAQRGAELVQKMLSFARKQALNPHRLAVQRVVADMDDLLRRTLGDNIEIETKISADLWPVSADKSHMESALMNLAINARDAMPNGGKLIIAVDNAQLDEAYAAANPDVIAGDYVMLAVSDTGTGIAPEILKQVVEPFFTTKDVGKGSGLGLSMIYGFIRQSAGHLNIYSEVGQGTTVRLYLPRADAAAAEPAIARDADKAPARGTERILIVEDDAMVRELVVNQLTGLGYHVRTAGNGPDAMKLLGDGEVFDLLFTDMMMPGGMNGHELADAAQRRCPRLHVLFTSGYTEDVVVQRDSGAAPADFLSKPYTRNNLAIKIRQALDRPKPG